MRPSALLVCCGLAAALGCRGAGDPSAAPSTATAAAPPKDDSARDVPAPPSSTSAEPPREPVLLVTDREALAVVEAHGGSFGEIVDGPDARGAANDALFGRPPFRSIADVLSGDIHEVQRKDPRAGVSVAKHPHRIFDVRWLSSADARFELVAVVDRLDRRAFHAAACGETRLVYRLAYQRDHHGAQVASRLPMTVNVELRAEDRAASGGCRHAASRWLAPPGAKGAALGRWLVGDAGPLSARALGHDRLAQLVINVQTVRWPSAVRPDLGGHAEYDLRAFGWQEDRYAPLPLENTPDVEALRRDGPGRARLLAWLRDPSHLRGLDEATIRLPDEFLATRVVSVTPRGFARLANRPFRQLFEPKDLEGLPLSELRFARSPEAFVRRLDDMTCSGCHQRRAVAGFHLLGEDPPSTAPGNALAVAFSPHVADELERRRTYLSHVAGGGAIDDARPFAERAGPANDGYGAACGLGDPGFADWRCGAGLRCDDYESPAGERVVGVCLPATPGVGDPCEPRRVTSERDPHRDRAGAVARRSCEAVHGICEATSVGFPGGMCAAACGELPKEATCGSIAILAGFNACIAAKKPFPECLANNVRPGGLRACGPTAPCRDDYICARTATGDGACIPPYFLFQLRVDGH